MVVDQEFDNERGRAQPSDPQQCVLIYPRRGAFAVFDGRLGHGVLGSAATDLRATLLINWWSHQPQVRGPQIGFTENCQRSHGLHLTTCLMVLRSEDSGCCACMWGIVSQLCCTVLCGSSGNCMVCAEE